jgi:hypothetical protein
MDENKIKKILEEAGKIIAESPEFNGFHGNVTFNIAYGKAKNYVINQSILPEKPKK